MIILKRTFAEIDHAWLSCLLRIVEDIFETESIRSVGVFVVFCRVDDGRVVTCSIADQTYVTLWSYSPIFCVVAASCRNTCGMRAVGLYVAVAWTANGLQLFFSYIVASNVQLAVQRVDSQLVPHCSDAVSAHVTAVEIGM